MKKIIINKKNFKHILNHMMPSSHGMPNFGHAVNTKKLFKKFNKKGIKTLQEFEKKLGNEVVESYFTSKLFIDALEMRKKKLFTINKKKKLSYLLKKLCNKKKYFG
jgi:hypothetical protein